MMNEGLLRKLVAIGDQIVYERPGVTLYAVLQRSNSLGTWDLILAAPWVKSDEMGAIQYIAALLQSALTKQEMLAIARVVVLFPDDEPVFEIAQHTIPWKPDIKLFSGGHLVSDMLILKGYVFVGPNEAELHHEVR